MKLVRLFALVVGAALHAFAAWQLATTDGFAWPLLAHIVGAVAWGFGATLIFPIGQQAAWWLPAGCALTFPVAGPLASLGLAWILRQPPVNRSARNYVVWKEQPQGDWAQTLPAGASGQSIIEILQSPRTQLRRNAVLALRELEPQMAIPLLRKGLQDSDEQVRIYAQNILSTMLERFETGIKDLEQRLTAEPGAVLHAVRLAEQYYELVYLDVAGDDETAAHYLAKAQTLLTRAEAIAPLDAQIPFLGFKYALRARDRATAQRWFDRLQERGLEGPHVLPWKMELSFLAGDWVTLRELFSTFVASGGINPRIEELAAYWLGKTEAPR